MRARHEANRLAWNEGAARYSEEIEETIAFLAAGRATCTRSSGRTWAICVPGVARRSTSSARPAGIRFRCGTKACRRWWAWTSPTSHIANARRISEALGAPATWYRCDLLDTPHELDGTADLVYTGRGALCWLHDLDGWAAVIARLLKPGGILSVFDDHPVNWLFEMDTETLVATGYDYFTHSESSQGWPATYIGELDVPVAQQARKYERLWPLSCDLRGAAAGGPGRRVLR